jgi:hypothetical protein
MLTSTEIFDRKSRISVCSSLDWSSEATPKHVLKLIFSDLTKVALKHATRQEIQLISETQTQSSDIN